MLEPFIRQLGQELDMEEVIAEPESGHYKLPFEDDMDVEAFLSSQGHYFFKAVIGACPKENVEAFLTRIMEANLFGKGTRGAVIGLREEENLLTLSLEVDYNSTYQDWKDKLQDFVTVINFWRHEALNHH